MPEEIVLTDYQQVLKDMFTDMMKSEDENDVRAVLISLLENAKKKRRKDVTIEAPCAQMEIRAVE